MTPERPSETETRAPEYCFGGFTYSATHGLLHDGVPETGLPPRAGAVLEVLLSRPGEVISKDELLELAWAGSFVSEDSLTHAISLLRQAFDDDARAPHFIQTVHRRGYRFVASVSIATARGPATDKQDSAWRPSLTRAGLSAVGIVALITLAVGIYLTRTVPADAAAMPVISHILLSEFDTDGTADADGFAAAARPEVRDVLERETKLTVTLSPAAETANAPGEVVMSVAVELEGDRLVVVARVVDTDDRTLWRQAWDMPVEKAVGSDFARSLRNRVGALLDLTSIFAILRRPANAEAGLLVVHALELLLGPAQQDLLVALQVAETLARATHLDPGLARARAARIAVLAEAQGWRPWSDEELLAAEQELAAARTSDPDDPLVSIAAALLALLRGDTELARSELEQAERLAPDLIWIYLIRAEIEHLRGFDDLALATSRRAVALDPYLPAALSRVVDVHLWRGEIDEAETANRELEQLDNGGFWSGRGSVRIAWARGDHDSVERRLDELQERWANAAWSHRLAAEYYEQRGDSERASEARRSLDELIR